MALIRGEHHFDGQFTQVPNEWIRDENVSLEARALLIQLLSHRPGWRVSIQSLAEANRVGRDKIRRIIGELVEVGYLTRSERQNHDENGHLAGFDYITTDKSPSSGFPTKAKPTKVQPTKVIKAHKNTIEIEDHKIEDHKPIRAHQLPKDWKPNDTFTETFTVKYPGLDLSSELEAFHDYHLARGSTFKDWDAAFRTWCRNALKWKRPTRKLTNAEQAALVVQQMAQEGKLGELGG
jgi:hypothetical protein